jgi:hypothetical protein
MSNFDKIKPLQDKIDTLLLDIKDVKPNLYREYTLIVDYSINGFIDLGAEYIKDNPQELEIFLKKLNDIIKILNFIKTKENIQEEKEKRDRCLRIADRKFDKPSAYKSGAVVRCRKGDIWKDIKETDNPQSGKAAPYGSGFTKVTEELILEKVKETLRNWFARKGEPGKKGGWVDCNSPIKKDGDITGYKACGREKGEKRSKYPSCRPTAAQCKTPGKGTKWGKTK